MLLDLVLVNEVRNVGGVAEGAIAMTVNRGVDEELDAGCESCIDECLSLAEFAATALSESNRDLRALCQ